jgi:diaminopimelate decarboxylase
VTARKKAIKSEAQTGFVFREQGNSKPFSVSPLTLHCEDVSLSKLAEKYGTPLYVYSATAILRRLNVFEQSFRTVPHTVCYSVKANSNLSILRLLARAGCGFDVVSGGELERVLVADRRAARRVVFSGVGKTRDEITAALKAGILLFNVESESELWALESCAARLRKVAPLALRVNPDVAAETHPHISTGLRQHKFGVSLDTARRLYAKAGEAKHLRVSGVSVHIGSQIVEVSPFAQAVKRVADLVAALRNDGHQISFVDIGGGLGIDYQDRGSSFISAIQSYAKAVLGALRGRNIHLLLEPGRALVAAAGALVATVVYRKTNGRKRFLVVDAGMNDLIRPSLYGAHHEIVPLILPAIADRGAAPTRETVDVVGPVCESGDFFARNRELPHIEEGGLLAILDTGAYGMSLASNYNSRPRPAEILVRGSAAKVIRRREQMQELYSAELGNSWIG